VTQADALVRLASAATLFHTVDHVAYATVQVGDHRENYAVRSQSFRDWLVRMFYIESTKAPNAQALHNALAVLEAQARFDGDEHPVYVRVGEHGGGLFLDLGTSDWSAVAIEPFGWHVVSDPPVRFRRSRAMLSLPIPIHGGSLEQLRTFVNIQDEKDMCLLVAVIHAMLRPRGPYPVLVLQGEQGAAKSTTARIAKALVDPSTAPLRSKPRDEYDLLIAATHGHVLAFDNLSELPPWLSDAFCRLATGAGISKRQLYTDGEEFVLEAARPVILNGIEDLAVRDDLRDRAVVLSLLPIPDHTRRDEDAFWAAFKDARPALIGAFLDGVSTAMANLITVKLPAPPRMADFAVWAVAGMPAFGVTPEQFLAVYGGNRRDAVSITLDASAFAPTLFRFIESQPQHWCGTASELLSHLNQLHAFGSEHRASGWPQRAQALGNDLHRLAPALRLAGFHIEFQREPKTGRRLITVGKQAPQAVTPVTPVTLVTAEHGGDEGDDVPPQFSVAAGPGLEDDVPSPIELDRFKAFETARSAEEETCSPPG